MPPISPTDRVRIPYQDDGPHKGMLLEIYGVTTGDSLDCSGWFSKILSAVCLGVTATPKGVPTITAGTTLTFDINGLANDSVRVLIQGAFAWPAAS